MCGRFILQGPWAEMHDIYNLNRMPIILNGENYDKWLETETSVDEARKLLDNNRGSELVSYRVNREVNNSRASGSQLTEAA
jgi:putative SOS response-associated peptidase YedK